MQPWLTKGPDKNLNSQKIWYIFVSDQMFISVAFFMWLKMK